MNSTPNPSPDPIVVFRGHTSAVNALAFPSSSNTLFSGSADGELRVWNIHTKKCLYSSLIHDQGVLSIQPIYNNRILSQGREGVCKIWQIGDSNLEVLHSIQTNSFSFGKCTSDSEGDILASPSALDPSRIEVWDVKSQQVTQSIGTDVEKLGLCMFIKILPRTPHPIICAGYENGKLHWWDMRAGNMLLSQTLHSEPVLCFDTDNARCGVSGAADTKICVFNYNLENGTCNILKEISVNNAGIQDVKIREDKKIFATAGWDHRVRVYSWKKHNPLAILKYHTEGVSALDFSPMNTPGGSLLASASKDKKIAIWSIYNK